MKRKKMKNAMKSVKEKSLSKNLIVTIIKTKKKHFDIKGMKVGIEMKKEELTSVKKKRRTDQERRKESIRRKKKSVIDPKTEIKRREKTMMVL